MGNVVEAFLPPGFTPAEGKEWQRRASRRSGKPAWPGMDSCERPNPKTVDEDSNVASCYRGGEPHRHCVCGEAIDLDHGYCDDCFATLLRGGAMSGHDSERMRSLREAWLVQYGFVEFTADGLRVRK